MPRIMYSRVRFAFPTATPFFSHSSKDADCLARLKTAFTERTGGALQVFLSSDGQSIPFGRNWVHRVQEALQNAKLMVVFLTPSSLESDWIFFEAGYVYAKDIRVVPVGFLGVDLYTVSPPLGLLQGFNIASRDGLNNLIALTNEVFAHAHQEKFSDEDYTAIVGNEQNDFASSLLGEFTPAIERFKLQCKTGQTETLANARTPIIDVLRGLAIPFQFNGTQTFNCPGASIIVREPERKGGRKGGKETEGNLVVELICDPLISAERWELMSAAVVRILERLPAREIRLVLDTLLGYVREFHCRAGKLAPSEVEFSDRVGFLKINNLEFGVSPTPTARQSAAVTVLQQSPAIDFEAVRTLLNVLWVRGILHRYEPPDWG